MFTLLTPDTDHCVSARRVFTDKVQLELWVQCTVRRCSVRSDRSKMHLTVTWPCPWVQSFEAGRLVAEEQLNTVSTLQLCRCRTVLTQRHLWCGGLHVTAHVVSFKARGGGGVGDTTPAILAGTKRTENSFGIIWSSPRQLRVKNTLRVGHRGPVGRKTTQKPPQNTKKWKKIVKKRLFSRFGHFGQNSDFSRKKSKTGIFFDITKPPLAQIYPKSGL